MRLYVMVCRSTATGFGGVEKMEHAGARVFDDEGKALDAAWREVCRIAEARRAEAHEETFDGGPDEETVDHDVCYRAWTSGAEVIVIRCKLNDPRQVFWWHRELAPRESN